MTSADSSHKSADLVLAMSGPEDRLQLVLGKPEADGFRVLASREWTVPGESVRFLIPGLDETLKAFSLTTADIGKIACTRGPGSFTGLRLVLAAAEGIAAGCGAEIAGIDYLPLLAAGPASIAHGILHVLTYARRGLVYFQSFNLPSLREAHPLTVVTVEESTELIQKMSDTAFILGSGVKKNQSLFEDFTQSVQGYTLLDETWNNPSPERLLAAAVNAEYSYDPIVPLYARASDAEDNLPQIALKRGLDPIEATNRLKELQQS